MNLLKYLSESRGVTNSARRLAKIQRRFGVGPDRMEAALHELVAICNEAGVRPSLAVTAVLIERYPAFFERLARADVDLAVHGYVHTDHAQLSEDEQFEQLDRALHAFSAIGLQPRGFRHPYLRYNEETWAAAHRAGFTHASNRSIAWDVVDEDSGADGLAAYMRGLRLYGAQAYRRSLSLPEFLDEGILDIPASLPDDEAVLDRLGLHGRNAGLLWLRMLQQSRETGELLALVVHNERVPACANSLRAVLRAVRKAAPVVWMASLSEIEAWWRKRAAWRLRIESAGAGVWRVEAPAGEASILVRHADTDPAAQPWSGAWRIVPPGPFLVHSERAPTFTLGDDAPPELRSFLLAEGYAVGNEPSGCAILAAREFRPEHKRALTEQIEEMTHPLVRIGRWPGGAKSALAVTSDIDAMTLVDFLRRPLEV